MLFNLSKNKANYVEKAIKKAPQDANYLILQLVERYRYNKYGDKEFKIVDHSFSYFTAKEAAFNYASKDSNESLTINYLDGFRNVPFYRITVGAFCISNFVIAIR